MNSTKTEAETVAELAKKSTEARIMKVGSGDENEAQILILPQGMEATSIKEYLDEYRDFPERVQGTAHLTELASFVAHVNRFKDSASAIFADTKPGAPKLLAVLDYHDAKDGDRDEEARWCDHHAEYAFPLSPEWQEWNRLNKAEMSQEQFAAFIEGRILEIGDPAAIREGTKPTVEKLTRLGVNLAPPDALMALARGLHVRVGQTVINAHNLQTGETELTFKEEHKDVNGEALKVPNAFLVEVPVFKLGAVYQLVARLRYRVREQRVTYWYELHRTDLVFDHAVREAAETARKETGLPLFFGTPESA